MHFKEFIGRVQELTGTTQEEARKATEATLETLGERLHHTERDKLAAQLAGDLKNYLRKRPDNQTFFLEEFYHRVGVRAETGYPHAVERALGVSKVLQEAVSPGELEDVLQKLPEEFRELFGLKELGPLSPSAT